MEISFLYDVRKYEVVYLRFDIRILSTVCSESVCFIIF